MADETMPEWVSYRYRMPKPAQGGFDKNACSELTHVYHVARVQTYSPRHCHVNRCRSQSSVSLISSGSCGRTFPNTECFGAKALESSSVFEMTLNVEDIVDGGVDVEKSLCGSR
jgi:hypothetical protein